MSSESENEDISTSPLSFVVKKMDLLDTMTPAKGSDVFLSTTFTVCATAELIIPTKKNTNKVLIIIFWIENPYGLITLLS